MSFEKAKIIVEHSGKEFIFQFNPEEMTISQDNTFATQTILGLSAPLLQFTNGNMRTLETSELLFDTYDTDKIDKKDVREITSEFLKLMDIDGTLHAPPILLFVWGAFSFRCVLARASQKFIMFTSAGIPVRCRISATFNEFVDLEREAKRIKRQTNDYTKVYTVGRGETLCSIAAKVYKNPFIWRPIALLNSINDPRNLTIGQELIIPSLPFTDPETLEVYK